MKQPTETTLPFNQLPALIALSAILLLAGILRWHDLFKLPLDWDEANTLSIALLPWWDSIRFALMRDIHPPGIFLSVKIWTLLAGSTDIALRLFPWFWSLLAVWASYLLGGQLSNSRQVGCLTALFTALMPLSIRYSQFVTNASIYHALVIFSWYSFLKWLDSLEQVQNSTGTSDKAFPFWQNWWFWAYMLITFWTSMQYASGVLFLAGQGLYLLLIKNRLKPSAFRQVLLTGIMLIAANIPHKLILLQPWHVLHFASTSSLHPVPAITLLLFAPLLMFAYNVDIRVDDMPLIPDIWQILPYFLLLCLLLGLGIRALRQERPHALPLLVMIGPLSLILAYDLTFAHFNIYNFRSLMYAAFPVCFVLAFYLVSLARHNQLSFRMRVPMAAGILLLILSAQVLLPYPISKFPVFDWRAYGQMLQKTVRPGDGVVIYPGSMGLPIMRYYKPEKFGITDTQLHLDPRQGFNFFRMIDRIDDEFFMVSGDELMRQPQIQQAFLAFQRQHDRLIFIVFNPPTEFIPLLDCSKLMLLLDDKKVQLMNCKP